ncbi:MAG TPA: carboxypeptidase-like regulatory domain-containing protein [Bryobacteraceae bacterium]|nr:carboxypeptidase-like regulatory domain-containing protein [Bryobacteraceae bacterium]
MSTGGGLILFWAALPVYAQVNASISGHVEDASGAAIRGAKITVTSVETGAIRSASTDDSGNYRVLQLPVGEQQVKAEEKGFKPEIRGGIHLQVGQEAVVNFKLEVGEFVQAVTVSEDAPVVNTTTAQDSGVVGEREVKDLPLNGRSFDNLITLNPATINYSAMKSPNTSTSDGNTFSVAGRRTSENLFLLNGIEYTGSSQLAITPGGVSGELLGIDAVREFNVLTDTYGAEYGKRAGAQVSVVTQSGGNAVHGSLFEFLRNSDLDARNFFDQSFVPPFRRNQFGGALGGPLKKDKLFLFGNYEGFRQALALTSVSVVPDPLLRQGELPDSCSGKYSTYSNLNPAMLKYMALWPQPNGPELMAATAGTCPSGSPQRVPTGVAESFNNPRENIQEDFGTARGDYIIGEADTLSTAYTIDTGHSLIPQADPLFGSAEALSAQVASLQETHVLSPWMLNVFIAGFSRAEFNLNSALLASFPAADAFVSGGGPGGIVIGGGVTTTTGNSNVTSAGPNNAAGSWNRRNLYTVSDSVQMTRGIHQFSFGAWFQRMQDNEDSASRQLGQASFSSLTTFLQGTVSSFQIVPDPNELGWRSLFGAWYAQDVIRVLPNLTIQIGVRDEFTTGWNEVSGRAANYLTQDFVLQPVPFVGKSAFTVNHATRLFAPRVSLAWDPLGRGTTAIRAAFGTYYSLIDDLSFLLNTVPPYNGSVSYSNVPLPSLIPVTPGIPPAPQCTAPNPFGCTMYAPQGVQPDAKTPAVQEWNLTIEQQLDRNTSLRVAYLGSFGYHGLLSVDPNTIAAQICQNASGCSAGGIATAASLASTPHVAPQGAQYIPGPGASRPDPFLGAGFFWYTEGNTSYNALETDVVHRLARGLQFRANYTWSKDLDFNSALTGAQANNQPQMVLDRNDLKRDWGPSALNITSQASISGSYDLPFARKSRLGGWQVNAIVTMLSGFPMTPQVGSNRSGDGDTRNPDRPNLNPSFSGPIIKGKPNQWFDPNAFLLPAPGTYGNVGRGTMVGPGLASADVSLFKTTRVAERASLQIRAEFFNVLNHANFATPNATVFSGTAISGSAGLITATATTSRQIQFGMKLVF